MQFASPTSFLWLLLAAPIVFFYILKIRLRRQPVSTGMFWSQVFDERKPRSIWQKFRHLISLLLQLAFLGLLVFAIADPFLAGEKNKPRRIVLVIDNSASMNVEEMADFTRLDEAKRRAARLIRSLRLRDQMAIVSAGNVAKVETGLTNHQRTLVESLRQVSVTDGSTQVPEAVQIGQRLLAEHENARIVVLTDGCFAEASTPIENRNTPHLVQLDVIGGPVNNVAITQFQVRRSLMDVIGYQMLVEVTNFSTDPVSCRLEVALEDDLVDVIPLNLEPSELKQTILDHVSPSGGRMVAKVDVEDALAIDNQSVAILPKLQPQSVVLVTAGNLYLQSALSAVPLVTLQTVSELPQDVPENTIIVFDGTTPQQLPPGNSFVIQPQSSSDFWRIGEVIPDPIVVEQDVDSPLLAHVQLENVVMPSARSLQYSGDHQVLASSIGGESLYVLVEHTQGQTLVLSVDLQQGDLPLRTAFPIMVTNAINHFRGDTTSLYQSLATGAIVDASLEIADQDRPPTTDAYQLVLRSPNSKVADQELPLDLDRLTLGPLDAAGVWQVVQTRKDAPLQYATRAEDSSESIIAQYACNLNDPRESNLRNIAQSSNLDTVYAGIFGGRPIWFYLIVLAFLLTTFEWFLYQRRWIS